MPSQILLNFCVALSLTLIVFLAAAESSNTSSPAACRTAAIALHYFLLSSFLWMAVEAFNMYRAFVKVFPTSNPSKFMLKCCLFAWGKDIHLKILRARNKILPLAPRRLSAALILKSTSILGSPVIIVGITMIAALDKYGDKK